MNNLNKQSGGHGWRENHETLLNRFNRNKKS